MTQRNVKIETSDGTCPAVLCVPDGEGPWPAVILFADAGGMRDTMREMGDRLSALGYVALVPDFYYRNGPYEPVDMRTAFQNPETAQKILGMLQGYTADMVVRDANAWIDYLDTLPEKEPGGVGTTGYCFGGRLSLTVAGNLGDRIAAAASFHGGNIAVEADPDSPHHKAGDIKGTVYVGGATDDQFYTDEQKALLDAALTAGGVPHTMEKYAASHGFAVPDNLSYDAAAAERHWKALEGLLGSVFGS